MRSVCLMLVVTALTACSNSAPEPKNAEEGEAATAAEHAPRPAPAPTEVASSEASPEIVESAPANSSQARDTELSVPKCGDPGVDCRVVAMEESRRDTPYTYSAAPTPPYASLEPTSVPSPPVAETAKYFWNTWVVPPCPLSTRLNPFAKCPLGVATREQKNTFVLSISMNQLLDPLGGSTPAAASGIGPYLDSALGAEVELTIIPLLTDGNVALGGGALRVEKMKVDRTKLLAQRDANQSARAASDLHELVKAELANSAGKIELPLIFGKDAPPCTSVTLAIWADELRQPLDSLTVQVPVGDNEIGCAQPTHRSSVLSGVESFLSFVDPVDPAATTTVGLHSFEYFDPGANQVRSFVVVAGRENGKPYVYGWETDGAISKAISNIGALPEEIRKARLTLNDPKKTRQQRAEAYVAAGMYLQKALFTARPTQEGGQLAATTAFEVIQRIVANDQKQTTVLARFTTPGIGGLDLFYSPLRLLATAGKVALAEDIAVVQPLPIRRRNTTCIDRWTIVGSPDLVTSETNEEAHEALQSMLAPTARPWVGEVITTDGRLLSYFEGSDPAPKAIGTSEPASGADGLLLLAHHDDVTGIFFKQDGSAVRPLSAARKFRPGSAAVLAACATAKVGSADGFVKRLNANNIDGVIASPFLVDATYATLMSHEIFKELDRAYTAGETPTIAEILRTAVQNTGRPSMDSTALPSPDDEPPDTSMSLQGLEYVMAGNPDLKLCKLQSAGISE